MRGEPYTPPQSFGSPRLFSKDRKCRESARGDQNWTATVRASVKVSQKHFRSANAGPSRACSRQSTRRCSSGARGSAPLVPSQPSRPPESRLGERASAKAESIGRHNEYRWHRGSKFAGGAAKRAAQEQARASGYSRSLAQAHVGREGRTGGKGNPLGLSSSSAMPNRTKRVPRFG